MERGSCLLSASRMVKTVKLHGVCAKTWVVMESVYLLVRSIPFMYVDLVKNGFVLLGYYVHFYSCFSP